MVDLKVRSDSRYALMLVAFGDFARALTIESLSPKRFPAKNLRPADKDVKTVSGQSDDNHHKQDKIAGIPGIQASRERDVCQGWQESRKRW